MRGVRGAGKLLSADADVVDLRQLLSQRRRKGTNTSPAQAAQRTERLVTGQDAHGTTSSTRIHSLSVAVIELQLPLPVVSASPCVHVSLEI